jgi:hypothetical protein
MVMASDPVGFGFGPVLTTRTYAGLPYLVQAKLEIFFTAGMLKRTELDAKCYIELRSLPEVVAQQVLDRSGALSCMPILQNGSEVSARKCRKVIMITYNIVFQVANTLHIMVKTRYSPRDQSRVSASKARGAGRGARGHVQRAGGGKHAVHVCDDGAGAWGGLDEGAGGAGGGVGEHVQRAERG